ETLLEFRRVLFRSLNVDVCPLLGSCHDVAENEQSLLRLLSSLLVKLVDDEWRPLRTSLLQLQPQMQANWCLHDNKHQGQAAYLYFFPARIPSSSSCFFSLIASSQSGKFYHRAYTP